MEGRALRILDELPHGAAIDLLHQFAIPLCLDLAMRITGACETDRVLLAALAAQVFALVADPDGEQQRIVSEATGPARSVENDAFGGAAEGCQSFAISRGGKYTDKTARAFLWGDSVQFAEYTCIV